MRRDARRTAVITLLLCALGAPGAQAQWAPAPPPAVEEERIPLAPGDTLAVTASGAGEPIILVPGLLGGAYGFRHVREQLAAEGYRAIIIEPLGTGGSTRPREADYTLEAQAVRMGAVLDSLGIASAGLVCHSVGASICMRFALRAPGRVRGIVSLNGGPDERAATGGLKGALRLAPLLKLFGGERIARGKVRGGLKGSAFDPAWVTEDVVRGYTAPYRDLTSVLRTLNAMADAREPVELRPRLGELRTPVLLLLGSGAKQPVASPADVALMTEQIPGIRVDSIASAGQYIHEEQPQAVVAAVLAFFRGIGIE